MKGFYILFTLLAVLAGSLSAGNSDDIKIKGDLRYRHEMIDEEGSDANHRHRIRARLFIGGKVNDEWTAGVQLATGSDDPVSTNQTLDGAFSSKNLVLDLAYFEYQPELIDGLELLGGKFKNPFYKPGGSELLWDSDFNPEGGAVNFEHRFDNLKIRAVGAGLWIDQRSDGDDSWLASGQLLGSYKASDQMTLTLGGGFFNYVNTKGFRPFYDPGDPFGNSVDADTLYINDYELLELYLESKMTLGEIPVTVMGDYVTNTAADSLETGWLVGVHIGSQKEPGSWTLRYIYREVEKDAVLGTFADSDFRGGGTDARGHEIGGKLQVAKNASFDVTCFINKIGLDQAESDFNRLQIDLQLKF